MGLGALETEQSALCSTLVVPISEAMHALWAIRVLIASAPGPDSLAGDPSRIRYLVRFGLRGCVSD